MYLVAEMYADNPLRCYEVGRDENGNLFTRLQSTKKWEAVHMGINPDLDTYLRRCVENFGWEVESFNIPL